jgi:hypothetical protein
VEPARPTPVPAPDGMAKGPLFRRRAEIREIREALTRCLFWYMERRLAALFVEAERKSSMNISSMRLRYRS